MFEVREKKKNSQVGRKWSHPGPGTPMVWYHWDKNGYEGSYHVRLGAEVSSARPTPVQVMVDLVGVCTRVDTCVLEEAHGFHRAKRDLCTPRKVILGEKPWTLRKRRSWWF